MPAFDVRFGRHATTTIPPPPPYSGYMAVSALAILLGIKSGNRELVRFFNPLTIIGSVGALTYFYKIWGRAYQRAKIRAMRQNIVHSQRGAAMVRQVLEHKIEENTAKLAQVPNSMEKATFEREIREFKDALKEVDRLEREVQALERQL